MQHYGEVELGMIRVTWLARLGCTFCLLSITGASQLLWSDEFDAPHINETTWTYQTGYHVGPGLQEYTKDAQNSYVQDGHLVIAATRVNSSSYRSARFQSRGKVTAKFGKVEARIQLPANRRYSLPAFWMLGENYGDVGWPSCGEIDIMEYPKDGVHGTVHSRNGSRNVAKGSQPQQMSFSGWHVFGIEWTSDTLGFFIDGGQPYMTVNKVDYVGSCAGPLCWPFDKEFFFILNIAIGSPWVVSEGEDPSAFPIEMKVDWVRVYEMDGPSPSPSPAAAWIQRASTSGGDSGCDESPTWSGFGYGSLIKCEEHCDITFQSRFIEYHASKYCGCFQTCNFARPPTGYGSPADVYERTGNASLLV